MANTGQIGKQNWEGLYQKKHEKIEIRDNVIYLYPKGLIPLADNTGKVLINNNSKFYLNYEIQKTLGFLMPWIFIEKRSIKPGTTATEYGFTSPTDPYYKILCNPTLSIEPDVPPEGNNWFMQLIKDIEDYLNNNLWVGIALIIFIIIILIVIAVIYSKYKS